MNENGFTGRIPRLVALAAELGPLRPMRVSRWERLRAALYLWRTRRG